MYYYSYARSVEDANKEADRTLAWLGGHHPSLPVYYDLEDSYILQDPDFSKDKLTQIAQTFATVWRPLALSRVSMRTLTGLTTT